MRPTLHCGIQYVPSDHTGRFAADIDALFESTEMLGMVYVTHSFARLFLTDTLDDLLPRTRPSETFADTMGRLHRLENTASEHARTILADVKAQYGAVPGTIYIDLERSTIQREPYQGEYATQTMRMMSLLCNRVEYEARKLGLSVNAAPYRPFAPTPKVLSRPHELAKPIPDHFVRKWGGEHLAPILQTSAVWCHVYTGHDMQGARREDHAARQVDWVCDILEDAGSIPGSLWFCEWMDDDIYADRNYQSLSGLKVGLDRNAHRIHSDTHISFGGKWKIYRGLLKRPDLEPIKHGLDLDIGVDPKLCGEVMAEAWNARVVEPFHKVFGRELSDLEADVHQPGSAGLQNQ